MATIFKTSIRGQNEKNLFSFIKLSGFSLKWSNIVIKPNKHIINTIGMIILPTTALPGISISNAASINQSKNFNINLLYCF